MTDITETKDEQALLKADKFISDIFAFADKNSIKADNKLVFVTEMCRKIDLTDDEQLQFFCKIVTDSGLLFGCYDDDFKIELWLSAAAKSENLYNLISSRRKASEQLKSISVCVQSTKAGISKHCDDVFKLLMENGYASECENPDVLRDNLEDVEWIINNYADFDKIAPFVYFQVLTRNSRKMLEKGSYSLTVSNLFNYHKYIIEADNGKNFDRYTDLCQLYVDLLDIFPESDLDLCDICFLSSSNLSEWAFDNIEMCDNLPLYIDDIFSTSLFSCFDDGLMEFDFFKENEIDFDKLESIVAKKTASEINLTDENAMIEFAENPEKFVNSIMGDETSENENSIYAKAACYYRIIDEIDTYCCNKICSLISDKSKESV